MALRGLGRMVRKFSRDVDEVTSGFDKVIGEGPDPGVSSERAGRRAAGDSPRRKRRERGEERMRFFDRGKDIDLGFGRKKRGKKRGERRFF